MATSTSGFFSSFISTMFSFGRWVWAAPKKLAEGFSWFGSKKMDIPNTEQGRRLRQALIPDSSFDKLAQTWADASFGTKGTVFAWMSLAFGLLGLAFGAPILLSTTSLVIALGVHGLLVAHHQGRVKRIMSLVKEQEILRDEVRDTLESIQGEVVNFIQRQKKEAQDTFVQFKKDAQMLTKAVTVIDEQAGVAVLVNKQLEEVRHHIEITLHEVDEQALSWNKGLVSHQKVLGAAMDATHTFSSLVSDVVNSHKAFDVTVGELHDAASELSKPLDEDGDEEVCDLRIDLSSYIEQTHYINEQVNAFDVRFEQRKEKRIKDTDLLVGESILSAYDERSQAGHETLGQLNRQREVRTVQRAAHEAVLKNLLSEPSIQEIYRQENEKPCAPSSEARSTDLTWIESINQSISARQEQVDTLKENRVTHYEEGEHQTFVCSIETNLKTRSEQRKARRAQLEATCRFFAEPMHNAMPDETIELSKNITSLSVNPYDMIRAFGN